MISEMTITYSLQTIRYLNYIADLEIRHHFNLLCCISYKLAIRH